MNPSKERASGSLAKIVSILKISLLPWLEGPGAETTALGADKTLHPPAIL